MLQEYVARVCCKNNVARICRKNMNDLFQAGHNAALYMQNYIFTAYNQNKKITFAGACNVMRKKYKTVKVYK